MAAHRMEFPTQSEISTNYEAGHIPDPSLQRQLGRASLEGLHLANTVDTHPYSELEASLNHSIIGQPDAVRCTVNALNRDELRNPNRPRATMLYLGPTGVGKTQTARELARHLHPEDDSAYLRIDCSMFAQPHTVAALTGAPPGYVGREQKPLFDPDVIEKDKSVVVFDEAEKGSGQLHDLMLQIMEEGEVTLNTTGKKVSFKNSIIIITTNLGSTEMMKLLDSRPVGFQPAASGDTRATKQGIGKATDSALKQFFRPEFLNRIDQRVVFNTLNDEELTQVLDNYVEVANERYKGAGVMLEMTPELKERIVTSSEDRHQFGARPILRAYERMVESNLAQHINTGSIPRGSNVYAALSEESGRGYEYGEDVNFYFEPNMALMPRPKTKEVVIAAPEVATEEEDRAA